MVDIKQKENGVHKATKTNDTSRRTRCELEKVQENHGAVHDRVRLFTKRKRGASSSFLTLCWGRNCGNFRYDRIREPRSQGSRQNHLKAGWLLLAESKCKY